MSLTEPAGPGEWRTMGEITVDRLNEQDYVLHDFDVHMYLLCGKEKALLVDTGFGAADIKKALSELTGLPLTVVCTHGHVDHCLGSPQFDKVYAHELEIPQMKEIVGKGYDGFIPIAVGDVIDIGGRRFEVLLFPGHSPGAIALLSREERLIITGDNVATQPVVMYMEGVDFDVYLENLKKLRDMKDQFDTIYPAHGKVPLSTDFIDDLIECVEEYMKGNLSGVPAIGPDKLDCTHYSTGKASLFCKE